jgi:hypothetical protein
MRYSDPVRPRERKLLTSRVLPLACFIVGSSWLASCWSVDQLTNGTRVDDGGKPDGPSLPEAASDAAAPGSPCAGTHLFCDDFESGLRVGTAPTAWDVVDLQLGGVVELSTTHARSGMHALKATVPRNDALVQLFATLRKQLPTGTWRRMRVQTAIFLVRPAWKPTDNGTCVLAMASFDPPGGGDRPAWNFGLVSESASQMYVKRPSPAIATTTTPTPYDRWFDVSVEWDPAGTGKLVASVDGKPFDERTLTLDTGVQAPSSGATFTLNVGLVRFSSAGNVPTPPIETYIDDVVVDSLP